MELKRRWLGQVGFTAFITSMYLLLYIPIIILVVFSFNNASFPAPWSGFSLKWYYDLFSSSEIWHAFSNSLIVSLSATFLSLAMSVGLIYYHVMGNNLSRFLTLFYGNVIIPEIVLAVGLLSLLSMFSVPLGIPTLIVAHTVLGLGYAVPIVYTRFVELDNRIVESSLDLGATQTQTFFKITLPLLKPALIAGGLLVFILSFDDFLLSFFCAGSEAQTLSLYIFSMIRSGVSPVVNALSTVLLALTSLLVIIFCSFNARTKIF
ncbi:ABC transporter permease [Candidatus Dependentiae bacterium]|nr:ABC transporter permease [Candidatus Dependentiae bacterium]